MLSPLIIAQGLETPPDILSICDEKNIPYEKAVEIVKAALAAKFKRAKHPERIQQLVELIAPGLERIDPHQSEAEQLTAGVEANVRWSMRQVTSTPEVQQALREKRNILVVGAVYELATGKIRWLDA